MPKALPSHSTWGAEKWPLATLLPVAARRPVG